ncbi:hypothetical protein BDD12DRAFT_896654 [Trichophaea hybrida]|nr:hypothetical protein BDD12DRAFT_896654 [Trichophaea hybrida]
MSEQITTAGNDYSDGQQEYQDTEDRQNISHPSPTTGGMCSGSSVDDIQNQGSGTASGSYTSTQATSRSEDQTNAPRIPGDYPGGTQQLNVDRNNGSDCAALPHQNPGNYGVPGYQIRDMRTAAPADGGWGLLGPFKLNWLKQKQALEEENKTLHRDLHRKHDHFCEAYTKLQEHVRSLEHRHEELTASHIKSLTSTSTGLEPISDATFELQFRKLHDNMNEWRRKTFKTYRGGVRRFQEIVDVATSDGSPTLRDILSARILEGFAMRVGDFMEAILWGFLEHKILCAWFPGIDTQLHHSAAWIQDIMRTADTSDPSTKAEFWRAYSASLLFQASEVQKAFQDVEALSEELLGLFRQYLIDPLCISS